jgi:hypothetical protein
MSTATKQGDHPQAWLGTAAAKLLPSLYRHTPYMRQLMLVVVPVVPYN